MDRDHVSMTIGDDEIWEQRRARMKELESVNQPHCQVEFKCRINPLLHTATKDGDVDKFIEAIKKYSAEERVSLSDIIHIQGPSGNSFLHIAAGIKNPDILRALLEVIHDKQLVAKANYRGDTALHVAARAGSIHAAELLLSCGSIADIANDMGNTALHEAVKNSRYELTRLLLSRGSRAVYPKNKESKCPLYLAVETGNLEILKLLMEAMDENEVPWSRMQGMSPVHGAVMHQRLEMLKRMSKLKKELFDLRDAGGGTPLHLAAYVNYVDGVIFLVNEFGSSAFECDEEGYLPIHVACKMGHLEIIKELLRHWPDPEELLSLKEGRNILHVAAKYGWVSVVDYILCDPNLKKLINAKDKEGNTPLHVATLQWQPEVVFLLTRRRRRANLTLVNNNNLTAFDIANERKLDAPIHEIRTARILVRARAPRSKDIAICRPKGSGPDRFQETQYVDRLRNVANTRMVVATLIGTMTFAAGFSVPGGYNGSEPDAGIATLLEKPMYDVFVICNTVAMYSSIIAVVTLLWVQRKGLDPVRSAIRKSWLPLLMALATMSVAFMAGVYVTVSKRTWIAVVTLIIGITALIRIWKLYLGSLCTLGWAPNRNRICHFFWEYFIGAFIPISIYETRGRAKRPARSRN
ncbi:protein ACCELERATED CELL DEATH 6-like isoform X3 [Syzygium oleosum]|uniref:protein ACCELERATED CELL DEATH 6-like isoform X3 n=1 Tax=Syzygium oleosum TaxID=219896 RepID=UPI0011D1A88B|nr:protein ACCELERATED CELL DEATH 6-like isoform X3 [Syzygium oleosum]